MQITRGDNRRQGFRSSMAASKWLISLLAVAALFRAIGFGAPNTKNIELKDAFLPPWEEGLLDIHHLRVGPSESSFLIFPDGTTMMIDAGDIAFPSKVPKQGGNNDRTIRRPFPSENQTTSQWAADYLHHFWPRPDEPKTERQLDYFFLTHFHCDHMGHSPKLDTTKSQKGDYHLSGLTEVAEHFSMAKIVDRDYPNYDYPAPIHWKYVANYRKFLETGHQGKVEKFQVGSQTQFAMTQRESPYREQFRVVNLKSNLDVLSPNDGTTIQKIPGQVFTNPQGKKWNENEMSSAIRIDYGAFRYYEGGDQEQHSDGELELDTITPTAKAAGKVDVATANHHGRGTNQAFCDELDPTVVILQGLFSDQPRKDAMALLSQPRKSNPRGKRTILVTDIFPERLKALGASSFAAVNGHVVVRVSKPGPNQYYKVFMLDENRRVKSIFGPFKPRGV